MQNRTALRLMLLLGALAFPTCVDPLPTAEVQSVLCPRGCTSHSQPCERRAGSLPFLRLARRSLVQPLASLGPLPASLLAYLAALRGMRGGATAMAMPPSEFSHLGLSDLGQTSTALTEMEPRAAAPRATPQQLLAKERADLHKMNLVELQRELRVRGLSTRGLKGDLVDRLQEHIADAPAARKLDERDGTGDAATGKRLLTNDRLHVDEKSDGQRKGAKKRRLRLVRGRSRASGAGLDLLQQVTTAQDADLVFEVFPTQAEAFQFADARPGLGLQGAGTKRALQKSPKTLKEPY